MRFPTLDDAVVENKRVLVRVDINSPIDPKTREILDDTRIRECAPTLEELVKKSARVIVLAHQGRPGGEDFVPLEKHARKLGEILGREVKYVPDTFGEKARDAIEALGPCEILVLENVRFCPEETKKMPLAEQSKTELVRKLSGLVDLYVNDAFAAAHRAQPSLVGFGETKPTFAGRLMEKEIKALGRALTPEKPCAYALGGVKFDDSVAIIDNVLEKGIADFVLTGGLVGHAFLMAEGVDLGKTNERLMAEKGYEKVAEKTKRLLSEHRKKIKTPTDFLVDVEHVPKPIALEELPTEFPIKDIGEKTVEEYSRIVSQAKTVVANGPMGVFEERGFEQGTFGILGAMAESPAFTIVGGGHMVAAAQKSGLAPRIKHVSTGGGACISFLCGEKLPVVEMLMKAGFGQT